MRLIDADELKTAFPCGESVRTECVRGTIDNMPTIEPEPHTVWHNTYEEGFPPEGEQVLVTYDTSNSNFFWIDESIANDKGLMWSEDCDLWEKTKWAYFSDLLIGEVF